MWTLHDKFLDIVKEAQEEDYEGSPKFNLVNKFKNLKGALRSLNKKNYGQISKRVAEGRLALDDTQNRLQQHPLGDGPI